MVNLAHLIPVFPFIAFVINICLGSTLKAASAWVSILASVISLSISVMTYQAYTAGAKGYSLGTWISINGHPLNFGVMIDALTVMMLLVIMMVGILIQIYSIGYMHGDQRYSRYFAYLSLFMASMLGLVLADNLVLLYIFWEGVGLCSYLLISFWFERPAAATAGIKAFITTRIGDTGFLIGIFILYITTQTLDFAGIAQLAGHETVLTIVALLIFFGAMGKSAQFPLHVWLPDAMEGPTAVSALIHAATMVAAGVYLVARTYGLFLAYPICLEIVGIIGGISALMAASIATVNNDIKRILAYSTISQLGLMMLGLGVGGFTAGTFHLMTHAFFKALLFLCAGSVIHAVHTQDIFKMGGLFSKMKVTGTAFVIATLAISGVPPFAGFWSKDEILSEAFHSGHTVLFVLAALTSLLTAFYMWRLIFVVLFGKPREENHAHESPVSMTFPLIVLSFFAVFAGLIGSPFAHHAFQRFISEGKAEIIPADTFMMSLSTGISLAGILFAYLLYIRGVQPIPLAIRLKFSWLYRLLSNKYYIDEIYDALFVKPTLKICQGSYRFDGTIIDGLVNGVASLIGWCGELLRKSQTGLVQNYLLVQVVGIIAIIWTIGRLCLGF